MKHFFGKYRGKVENNIDPQGQGRVQISCPAVLGEGTLSWAMPCTPYGGAGVGLFTVPPNGANCWIEFEGGDPDSPILGGCFWGLGEAPASPPLPFVKIFKTDGITLKLDDTPGAGGVTIEVGPPIVPAQMTLRMTAAGIELTHGGASITMDPVRVNVNNGALEVM